MSWLAQRLQAATKILLLPCCYQEGAAHLGDRLLLIPSEHSMASEWVKTEIALARQKEFNKQVLFPISLVPFQRFRSGSASMPTLAKIPPVKSASTLFRTSADGRTTTPT
jgi:hypothetical protein